jgi:phage-related protein
MKNEIEETGNKLQEAKIKDSIDGIGDSITKTIKKVGKWALAIFSVRTAYGAVRNAISTLSQYNENLETQLNSIRLILATALEPIITRIISLVNTLLSYINYIAKAWFDVDLFANASAKAMQKSAGSAEKMKKSLTGFDEMNVISDTSSSAGGGAGAGFQAPEDVPIPKWIEWIADNKDLVIAGIIGIGTAIAGLKLIQLFGGLKNIGTILSTIWGLIQPIFAFISANASVIGGLIAIIGGLAIVVKGVINYLKDPTWENFGTMLAGIGIIAGGVLLIFGGIPALVTLIIGAVVALGLAIYKNWNSIKEFTLNLVQAIKDWFGSAIQWVKDKFNSMVSFFSNLISRIVNLFKTIGTKVGNAIGSAFKTVVNGVLKAIESILNSPIRAVNSLIKTINKVPGINISKLPTFSLPRLAVGGVVNMPGRGINYGGANIGERGAEGVIPLTNSQMMAQLGEAIGKYVNINATVPVYVGNRQIAREIKKISADSDFAFNR